MAAAKWTTKATEIKVATGADGTLSVTFPVYDNGVKAATLTHTLTAARALELRVQNEPGAAGLSDFRAWEV